MRRIGEVYSRQLTLKVVNIFVDLGSAVTSKKNVSLEYVENGSFICHNVINLVSCELIRGQLRGRVNVEILKSGVADYHC